MIEVLGDSDFLEDWDRERERVGVEYDWGNHSFFERFLSIAPRESELGKDFG